MHIANHRIEVSMENMNSAMRGTSQEVEEELQSLGVKGTQQTELRQIKKNYLFGI